MAPQAQSRLGAQVDVKVGRHKYLAAVVGMNQSGKVTAVQYTLKSGAIKTAQEGRFTLLDDSE